MVSWSLVLDLFKNEKKKAVGVGLTKTVKLYAMSTISTQHVLLKHQGRWFRS